MTNNEEICSGCALEKLCHKTIAESQDEADGCMRRKAAWLMFWFPLVIIAVGLFLMVGLLKWDELISFLIVIVVLTIYYLTLKLNLK